MENNIGMDWNSNTMVNSSEKSPLVEKYLEFFTFSQKTWLDGWFQGYLKGKGKGYKEKKNNPNMTTPYYSLFD